MSDFVDLADLGKHSSRFSPVGKPLVIGILMGILTFFLLVAFFGAPFWWGVVAGIASFLYVVIYFVVKTEGIPAPLYYLLKLWTWYAQKRKTDHIATYYQDTTIRNNEEELQKITGFEYLKKLALYLPFFGLRLKEKEPNYKHVADMVGVYGIKDNLVKLSSIDWVGFYRITPAINISTTSNREELESALQYILNIFNQRQTEIQVFFHKKELRRDNFDVYFKNLRAHKTKGNIEKLKHEHIADIEDRVLNQTLNTFLELTLGVYFTVKPTFLGNNARLWQEAKQQLKDLMTEVMDVEAFRIEQLTNKDVKMFLADLYLPFDKRDHSKQLIESTVSDIKEEQSFTQEEEDIEELTILQKVGRLYTRGVALLRTYFENTTALTDLDRDMSFVLPHNIAFEEDKECVKVDDGFETTLIVPTNNRIIDNSLVKTLAEHSNVFNVTFRLFPENKIRIISTLERKVHNESLSAYEEQENNRLGTMPQKQMSETEAYIDTLSNDHKKEVFKLCMLVNVEAKSISGLRKAVQEITKTVEDKLFIRVYKAVYEQKKHYLASKLKPHAKGRNSFYIDTKRLASLTPLPFYTFHDKNGFLLGNNAFTGEPAFFDPENFDYVESASAIVLAKTGQGKSTLFKLWQTRGSFLAHKNIIIDNTGEYSARIGKELDMKIFKVGTDEAKINPFQLFITTDKKDRQEIIKKQINQVLMPCFSALLSEVNYKSGLVDKLLYTYYDSSVKQYNMKTFVAFLYEYRKKADERDKDTIMEYITSLERFTKYSLSNVFGEEMDFKNLHTYQNIVFDVQEITKLRGANSQYVVSAILHIIIANLWIMAQVKRESMLVFIDEAHYLLESDETSSYLAKLAKDGRKDKIYLVLSTQDPLDFIGNKNGERVITNTFTKIYGKLEDIPERYLKILDINEQLAQTIKILPRGHFYMQRGKESMFFYTEFLNEWEKLLTDTEHTNYRDSIEKVLRTNHASF